jgi:fatty-acyl-CoA synthase
MVAVLLSGGTVVLHRSFDPARWLATVAAERITLSLLVPTMIYAVLDHADLERTDLKSLETIMYGASPISPTRLAEGIRRIGPVFCQLYGQTEGTGVGTALWRAQHLIDDLHRLTSCGMPIPGARVAVLDDEGSAGCRRDAGRDLLQGPRSCRATEATGLTAAALQDGWLRTGTWRFAMSGLFTIVDRRRR